MLPHLPVLVGAVTGPPAALLYPLAALGCVLGPIVLGTLRRLRRRNDQLARTEEKYRAVVENIPAISYVDAIDDYMSTVYVSPQIESILGISVEEYLTRPEAWEERLHPEDRDAALNCYMEGRDSGAPFHFEYRMISSDGREVWFRDHAAVLRDEHGRAHQIQGVMLDITDRKEAEKQVAYLAYHDKLTGLPNRAMFEEFLRMAVVRAKRNGTAVAVLYIDLDDFKLVNDTLGHGPGDELLRQVAERLRDSARQSDLVARQGGDEFLLLVTDVDPASGSVYRPETNKAQLKAESVAGRIQDALRDSFRLGDSEVYVTASIGISVFPVDAPDAENLLKNADTAMYLSKRVAPGGYMVFSGRQQIEAGKLSMATRLRQAVEAQQWELHYQPVLELATGAMEGVEALVRWRDPTGGLVAPGEFIPLAEEMGLIGAIGDWVLEELCRQAKEWAAVGLPLDVSFNVSPRQLWQPDVVSEILGRVRDAELSPERVIVEITESAAMADPERTQRLFRELQEQGVRLAIDDFGTGFSSLARLKQLPVDILKIDQMFVRDMTEATHSASMVRAVIDLAHGLGMIAQAEGIETEEQWKFLAEYGCELGQGYHFSRPVPGDQILTYARRRALALPVQR